MGIIPDRRTQRAYRQRLCVGISDGINALENDLLRHVLCSLRCRFCSIYLFMADTLQASLNQESAGCVFLVLSALKRRSETRNPPPRVAPHPPTPFSLAGEGRGKGPHLPAEQRIRRNHGGGRGNES